MNNSGEVVSHNEESHKANAVTRVDVARRQISAAVHMFFRRHDPVVIHSVAAAANRMLADLGMPHRAADFFDQAEWDASGRIDIAALAEANASLLMDAIRMLQTFRADLPVDMRIFCSWFVTTHGDEFGIARKTLPHLKDSGVDPNDFDQIAALIAFYQVTEDGQSES